ncbi:MAG TPA: DNA-binding response regulator [Elusimicrobia bacterium]|nr:DNA-binding response regulator [Elusimicrobiota bacterium]
MAHFRILVVEDEPNTQEYITEALGEGGFEVEAAGSLGQARTRLRSGEFDVLVIDRGLPDGDGLDLCAELRGKPATKDTPILFLSAKQTTEDRVAGLRTGGDDYLCKPFEAAELIARIDAILRRSRRSGLPDVLSAGALRLDLDARKALVRGKPIPLWAKEFDLLALLMNQKGRVVSRDFLLRRIWGYDEQSRPGTKVVDITISHLRDKLGPLGENLVTVRGLGYRLDL